MDCEHEDLKRYMNIIGVGGIRWSDANCYIFVHSCFGGVCVCVCVLYFVPVLTDCHQQMQAFQNVALSVGQ